MAGDFGGFAYQSCCTRAGSDVGRRRLRTKRREVYIRCHRIITVYYYYPGVQNLYGLSLSRIQAADRQHRRQCGDVILIGAIIYDGYSSCAVWMYMHAGKFV